MRDLTFWCNVAVDTFSAAHSACAPAMPTQFDSINGSPQRSRKKSVVVVRETSHALGQLAKPVEAIYLRPTKSAITLGMHRTYNVLLANAVAQGLGAQTYRIGTSELARHLETDSKNDEYLKDTARRLASTTVEWDYISESGKRNWGVSAMVASVQIIEGGLIEYSFSAHLKDKLLNPDVYARLNLRLQNRFRSRHSLALYEYCVRYRDNPGRLSARLPWRQWGEMLVGTADPDALCLREFKYFSRDVLKPAIQEVNAVAEDLEIEAIIEKEGRRVTTLQFSITPRRQAALAFEEQPSLPEALGARIAAFGIPPLELARLAGEHDAALLEATAGYVERRQRNPRLTPLDNPAAYFRQTLAKRYAKPVPATRPAGAAAPIAAQQHVSALRERFLAHRIEQARQMFGEMDKTAQTDAFEQFLATVAEPLRGGHRKAGPLGGRTVGSFTRWLAQHTWGEPSPEELLEFAAAQLGSG